METTQTKQPGCNIFLIGFMGAGKSTIAAELKRQLQLELIEMDQLIEEQQGMPITEIFAKYGEDHFRKLETDMLVSFQDKTNTVVSCGGGIVVRPENQAHMKRSGKVVLLTASPETVYERVKDSRERPILNGNMSVEYIQQLMEARRPFYEAAADVIIDTSHMRIDQVAEAVLSAVS